MLRISTALFLLFLTALPQLAQSIPPNGNGAPGSSSNPQQQQQQQQAENQEPRQPPHPWSPNCALAPVPQPAKIHRSSCQKGTLRDFNIECDFITARANHMTAHSVKPFTGSCFADEICVDKKVDYGMYWDRIQTQAWCVRPAEVHNLLVRLAGHEGWKGSGGGGGEEGEEASIDVGGEGSYKIMSGLAGMTWEMIRTWVQSLTAKFQRKVNDATAASSGER